MIRVTLEKLTKRHKRVAVVDGASLDIPRGELTFLLGPSGAGKSTLARLVAGLDSLDEGDIFFDERVMRDVPPRQRGVGLVFQDDALWPRLSVAANIEYGLKLQRITRPERRERINEAMGALRIDSLAQKRPDELTPLQRQRVSLARALAVRPSLLILDEPLGQLEERFREEFRDEIRRIHAETEITTLVLTQNPREALALADRVAVMDLGKIVQVGPPRDIYNHPCDTFVARFLGPTNLVQGQVESGDSKGEVVVRTPFGRMVGRSLNGPLPSGSPVTVSIRPDSICVGPSIPPGSNRFAATIERLVFLGEVRQVHLRGPSDWPVIALALQSQSQGLREGQSLTFSVPPELVVVLQGKYAIPKPG